MVDHTAVVLAAGEGTRLRPLTRNRPKPMLPAGTKPILEHVFDQLIDAGIDAITVVVGYRGSRIRTHFGPSYRDVELEYVTQSRRLGTGHALRAAAEAIDGTTVVVNGDQLADGRIVRDVVAAHEPGAAVTIGLVSRQKIGKYGGALLESDGTVSAIVENPTEDRPYLLNAGVYAVEPAILEAIDRTEPVAGERSLVDAISTLIDDGETVRGVVSDGLWLDATYPWDLLEVTATLFETGEIAADVAPSATVHESATVRSPVVIGRDCEVGPGAVVGPYTSLGENATVGAGAVVERSLVDVNARVGQNATVIDCVTGTGVSIGAASTIPGGPGAVRVGDRFFGEESIGALLADRVTDGGGVTYVPGTIVGAEVTVAAGATVRGTIEDETEVLG
ncbi:sugar phosphate nucleotidyltransferase [Natrarchaeobaculum aegyptiacum]|uniref:Bifunctional protein GlmU n=1 Tax=Natrarchaeobaculum aegyptiacum TaxID=745377 RepID=A0A2Z2HR92_9EURY|nr:sugar phosphate nucleotidyltransferase [Natrarchaeobaculum aegyptiacum]ARS89681.1 nucleotidyl transferase [Natrarchaeobaculum aegyptiacum]